VASALRWGFADFDDLSVDADKRTLTQVMELVKLRPMQSCIFLKAPVGVEAMLRMMSQAIGVAKQQGYPLDVGSSDTDKS
jgi:hypothetical protein